MTTGVMCNESKPTVEPCKKCEELALLLIECRDALPAITIIRARMYNVKLDLADRIDLALYQWQVDPGTPGAI